MPATKDNLLEFRGRKFVIGQGRMGKQETKTENENYYLLTLAAIAKELKGRTGATAVKVNLAVGVPLTLYGKEKKEFKNYLRANDKVSFFYKGVRYVVHFGKVRVFAQCHAAIANRMEGMDRLTAVDCGSWTLDIMSVVNKVPVLDECHTYQQGLITAIDRIQKECITKHGKEVPEYIINEVNEHARYKYQYEKDGDVTVYLYHEAYYREQLAELKERRKEAKRECATTNRCISESTFAHMEIPLDVDVENLYMVDVPEFEGSEISYAESEDYDEVEAYKMAESDVDIEVYGAEVTGVDDVLPEVEVAEREPVAMPYELINESIEGVDESYADLQNFAMPDMTKERYETLTDKEKVEWLGIAECSVQDAIQSFISKLDSIGVVYRYSDDMLDEFMRLESVVAQMKREEREAEKEQGKKIEPKSRSL